MRCINARRVSEVVGTVALVVLVLLPKNGFCTNDDVGLADSDSDCDDSSERSGQGERTGHARGCGGGSTHHATEATSDSSAGVLRPSKQQWIDRQRRKETWKNVLLQRLWLARRNSSAVGTHVLPRHLHTTDLQDFKALLDRAQPIVGRTEEQDPIARNRVYLPQCSGPRNFSGTWNDGTNFRLYFNVEPVAESSGHRPARETKVLSAYLHLKRKTTPTASSLRATSTVGRTGRLTSGEVQPRGGQRMATRRRRPLRGVSDGSASDGGDSDQLKVIVYLYSRPTKRTRQETRSVIRTVLFSRNLSGWLKINVTPTVDDWWKRPQRNFGIQVTVLNEGGTEELPPGEYFEGFNCTEDQSHPVEFPLWTLEDNVGQSSTNDTVVDSEMNLTQPYLDIITEVTRSRSRHQRDLRAVRSAPSALRRTKPSTNLPIRHWN